MQIGRLLDPSLQYAKFIFDELIKMSHHNLAKELHQYPFLRKCLDEVIGNFLQGLQLTETMKTHLIEIEEKFSEYERKSFGQLISSIEAQPVKQVQEVAGKSIAYPYYQCGMRELKKFKRKKLRDFIQEVGPCEDVTDGTFIWLFRMLPVLRVPFEVLVRRQIGRLLDPSLQCAKFIYDELIKTLYWEC